MSTLGNPEANIKAVVFSAIADAAACPEKEVEEKRSNPIASTFNVESLDMLNLLLQIDRMLGTNLNERIDYKNNNKIDIEQLTPDQLLEATKQALTSIPSELVMAKNRFIAFGGRG